MYLALKHLHLTFAALSLLVFVARGFLLLTQSTLSNKKIVRIAPHMVYTLMLVTGIVLAVHLGMKPSEQPWLLAKIIGLIIFILLGIGAFKVRNTLARAALWLGAILAFAYVISVAISKNPSGFLPF